MHSHFLRMAAGKKAASNGGALQYFDDTYWVGANGYLGVEIVWQAANNRWYRPDGTFGDLIPINNWEIGFRPSTVTIDITVINETASAGNRIQAIDTNNAVLDVDNTDYGVGDHVIVLNLAFTTFDLKALQFGDFGFYDSMYITNIVFA